MSGGRQSDVGVPARLCERGGTTGDGGGGAGDASSRAARSLICATRKLTRHWKARKLASFKNSTQSSDCSRLKVKKTVRNFNGTEMSSGLRSYSKAAKQQKWIYSVEKCLVWEQNWFSARVFNSRLVRCRAKPLMVEHVEQHDFKQRRTHGKVSNRGEFRWKPTSQWNNESSVAITMKQ